MPQGATGCHRVPPGSVAIARRSFRGRECPHTVFLSGRGGRAAHSRARGSSQACLGCGQQGLPRAPRAVRGSSLALLDLQGWLRRWACPPFHGGNKTNDFTAPEGSSWSGSQSWGQASCLPMFLREATPRGSSGECRRLVPRKGADMEQLLASAGACRGL